MVERTPEPVDDKNSEPPDFGIIADNGTDISVNGVLDLTSGTITNVVGTAGGDVQGDSRVSIGWTSTEGQAEAASIPRESDHVDIGQIAQEQFSFYRDFDTIAEIVTIFENYPYVDRPQIFRVAQEEEAISEALREELLKLRIFARNLSDAERLERREAGYVYTAQLIVDESAPISAYEVAVSRISTETAQRAVDYAKELMGEDESSLAAMGLTIDMAFEEFLDARPDLDGLPDEFAEYVSTASTETAAAAYDTADRLNQLFAMIAHMGITETELSISRRNILSRLKVRTLRGRELIEFFDSFMLVKQTELTLN